MASIVIADLSESTDLDAKALAALVGGRPYVSGFSWIAPFQRSVGSFQPQVVNQFFTLNQFIADEIQIINQEQYVSISHSPGATAGVNADADNGLRRSLPGLV